MGRREASRLLRVIGGSMPDNTFLYCLRLSSPSFCLPPQYHQPETIKLRLKGRLIVKDKVLKLWQRGERDVINDTYCKVVLRLGQFEVFEYREYLCRRSILRAKTIAPPTITGALAFP